MLACSITNWKLLFKAMICIATYVLRYKKTHTDEQYEHIAQQAMHAYIYTYSTYRHMYLAHMYCIPISRDKQTNTCTLLTHCTCKPCTQTYTPHTCTHAQMHPCIHVHTHTQPRLFSLLTTGMSGRFVRNLYIHVYTI